MSSVLDSRISLSLRLKCPSKQLNGWGLCSSLKSVIIIFSFDTDEVRNYFGDGITASSGWSNSQQFTDRR